MKLLYSLCVLLFVYISSCYAGDTPYAIWNQGETAYIGYTSLPQNNVYPKLMVNNAFHPNQYGNQLSTLNRVTNTLSFIVNSSIDNQLHLETANVDSWTGGDFITDFPNINVLSIESTQSKNPDDLFIVMDAGSGIVIAKINPLNGTYTVYDRITNYKFGSASFDQSLKYFVAVFVSASNYYIVYRYDINGLKVSADTYSISNLSSYYGTTGLPSNLVYLPAFQAFYLNLKIYTTGSTTMQLFQLYAPNKVISFIPVVSSSGCSSNPAGIVQAHDPNGSSVIYQYYKCNNVNAIQEFNMVAKQNMGVFTTGNVAIINAWN